MSDNMMTTVILAIFFVAVLAFVLVPNGSAIKNDGNLVRSEDSSVSVAVEYDNDSDDMTRSVATDDSYMYDSMDESVDRIRKRAMGRNNLYRKRTEGNNYKENSYRSTEKDLESIDNQFMVQDVAENHTDRYTPMDESAGFGAPIQLDGGDSDETKYNLNAFLPQEENKDWFETIETTDVKNSHLINLHRPIGVNTIGSSNKGASYDLRGYDGVVAPKFVTGPFNNSSWEPHRGTKSLCA
jgi:hypothetical protein